MLTFDSPLQHLYAPRLAGLGYAVAQSQHAPLVVVTATEEEAQTLQAELNYFAPHKKAVLLPMWDVQPYDRLSPTLDNTAARLQALKQFQQGQAQVLVCAVANLLTRFVPPNYWPDQLCVKTGQVAQRDALVRQLFMHGYRRVSTVVEVGDVAIRGAYIDIFPYLSEAPLRLEWDDDIPTAITPFDPESQRLIGEKMAEAVFLPAVDFVLDEERIRTFRTTYRSLFENGQADSLYEAISAGSKPSEWMHFIPCFFTAPLVPFNNLMPEKTGVIFLAGAQDALDDFAAEVNNAHIFRTQHVNDKTYAGVYRPLPVEMLYVSLENNQQDLQKFPRVMMSTFQTEHTTPLPLMAVELSKRGHLVPALAQAEELINTLHPKKVFITSQTHNGLFQGAVFASAKVIDATLEQGFFDQKTQTLYLTEADILGAAPARVVKTRRNPNAIEHFSQLVAGDYIIHDDHGVGQFLGLETLDVQGNKQDFLKLLYANTDRLFVPVESMNRISRYRGGDMGAVVLDKLGGTAWAIRKERVKKDILAMAGELMQTAAQRTRAERPAYTLPADYTTFCNAFAYVPTPDQSRAISEIEQDLRTPNPADRLVVGDVGFGKTEVALRAAFVVASHGRQVAVVVPTTLLARQHGDVFAKRFADFPLRVKTLHRLNPAASNKQTLAEVAEGKADIIIGTHALLGSAVKFADLGLLIIDEEQHFGVAHKEKLKKLAASLDVITLSATPIPRTLQLAVGGVRQLSLITTPPVDRHSVHTYVMPFDGKTLHDAITRELHRGGQVFVVTPFIDDMKALTERLTELVPQAKFTQAHGQMAEGELDDAMTGFYDGKTNVLIATNIIESGLDVPRANTIIVHRADRFGLSQLHQLRGRVGRARIQAYAYFLLPEQGQITENAQKRLEVLQRLQGLGSGFMLANYDMDIRGAGNILGKEQSGHVKDIGFELYTKLLAEAVAEIKANAGNMPAATGTENDFTPTLNLGLSYRLPEEYVTDVGVRLQLYRRLAAVGDEGALMSFQDELTERFGAYPAEVARLLDVVRIRNRCRVLNVSRLDVGDKGVVITFRENTFPQVNALVQQVQKRAGVWTIRPDQKLVIHKTFGVGAGRIHAVGAILAELESLYDTKAA